MRIIRKKHEIIPPLKQPALPSLPPEQKPHEEGHQNHQPRTEIISPQITEIEIFNEEEALENDTMNVPSEE